MRTKRNEELIGTIGVDAGIVMVGDPCYHMYQPAKQLKEFGFPKDLETLFDGLSEEKDSATIGEFTAVLVSGFGGDGIFPVYITRDAKGRVAEMIVRFECGY